MSALSLATALRAARRALRLRAEAARPVLERRIGKGRTETAIWAEETEDGTNLRIVGDGMDSETARRIVGEILSAREDDG